MFDIFVFGFYSFKKYLRKAESCFSKTNSLLFHEEEKGSTDLVEINNADNNNETKKQSLWGKVGKVNDNEKVNFN